MRAGIMISAMIWMLIYVSACSVKIGVDWHGETAKDDKSYTQKK